jgi:hypothetical protein
LFFKMDLSASSPIDNGHFRTDSNCQGPYATAFTANCAH